MSLSRLWNERVRRTVAAAVLVSMGPSALGASELPVLGDATNDTLTVAEERALGDRIMRQILPDPDVLDDAPLQDYLDTIWQSLVSAAKRRGDLSDDLEQHHAWRAFLVRDRTVNAFALPGGYVGVHLGLISMTASRDELAAVLAHELTHVTQRHIARSMALQKRQSILSIASLLLGVMAASRSPDAANALITGGQAVAVQGQLNFSRDMEREADRVGYGVLTGAGFEGQGMSLMFDHLQRASGLMDNQQYPYLRTHPLTTERIAEARSRLGVGAAAVGAGAAPSGGAVSGATQMAGSMAPGGVMAVVRESASEEEWLHAVMRGRARAMMDSRTETSKRLAQVRTDAVGGTALTSTQLTDAVAATMAARRLHDLKAEDAALAQARLWAAPHPSARRAVATVAVESALARGQTKEALLRWKDTGSDGSRASTFLECQMALAPAVAPMVAPGLAACAEELQTRVSAVPSDAGAWTLLGQARERQGQRLAALRAQAEAQFAIGNTQAALDRLRAGEQLARTTQAVDGIEATVINARLKVMEQRRRQELEDQRRER